MAPRSTGLLFAQSQGSGDLVLSHAAARATNGSRFVSATATDRHPCATGTRVQACSRTTLRPDGEHRGLAES